MVKDTGYLIRLYIDLAMGKKMEQYNFEIFKEMAF